MAVKIPSSLVSLLKTESCGLYVGAGVSMASKFPSWKELLELLIQEVQKLPSYSKAKIKDYEHLIKDPNNYLLLAEDLKAQLPEAIYTKFITDTFSDSSKKPSDLLRTILKLPSSFVITTNYDSLIEQAYYDIKKEFAPTLTYDQSRDIAYNLWEKKFFILKAHGDIRINSSRVVLTENDYREIIFRQPGYQSALHAMFTYKSVLFLGTSFSDPDLILFLRYLHNSFHGGGPGHYILLPKDSLVETQVSRYMEDFNLHTIRYDSKDNHKELLTFARALLKETKPN